MNDLYGICRHLSCCPELYFQQFQSSRGIYHLRYPCRTYEGTERSTDITETLSLNFLLADNCYYTSTSLMNIRNVDLEYQNLNMIALAFLYDLHKQADTQSVHLSVRMCQLASVNVMSQKTQIRVFSAPKFQENEDFTIIFLTQILCFCLSFLYARGTSTIS